MKPFHATTSLLFFMTILIGVPFPFKTLLAQNKTQLVRLAVVEVDTAQLDRYCQHLKEEIKASIQLEPGVITLYSVAEKENPGQITLFETYSDSSSYKAHLTTPHFQKYKRETLNMVTHLELIEMLPVLYIRKSDLSPEPNQKHFVRLIRPEIYPTSIEKYTELVQTVTLPGIKKEPGILLMYAVAEKKQPTRISILEVYADTIAYQKRLTSPHFLKYKKESQRMIKSSELIEVTPIFLGSKSEGNAK